MHPSDLHNSRHIPLHRLPEDSQHTTGGRIARTSKGIELQNAHTSLILHHTDPELPAQLAAGQLVRVVGHREGSTFFAHTLHIESQPSGELPRWLRDRNFPLHTALQARNKLNQLVHDHFQTRGFLEVETPAWVAAPGCDPHLEPVAADFCADDETHRAYLHTSPEFAMKRLLAAGSGPIYQLAKVWRNGEVTDLHNPEFTLLEWYRPWREVDAIMEDVEQLVHTVLETIEPARTLDLPIRRMTMQQLVQQACGFDILAALDASSLREEVSTRNLLSERSLKATRWDELFFSLTVAHLDPFLETQGAVFVTHWPAPLAILAKQNPDDPRVADRFELYIDGIELANGFGELTDPVEQRRRFEQDNKDRRQLGRPELPIPEAFLAALEWGLPPSAGVALGIDRLLMLATGASNLTDIAPFALYRNARGIHWP